ncbi:MAG TPA: HlyC/CorC family transporter, partial [Sorangium sp.]|nr:HlyC/CorC family transporter [Sorangium sp.]
MSVDSLPSTQPLVAACISLASAALFTGVDTALTSLSAARLAALAQRCPQRYRKVVSATMEQREHVQARFLSWRVMSVASAAAWYGYWLSTLTPDVLWIAAIGGMLILTLTLHLASSIGQGRADSIVPLALLVLKPFEWLVAPLAWLLHGLATMVYPSRHHKSNPRVTETEMEMMVAQGQRSGVFEHEPATMMRNLLDFSELSARDAMIPRTQMVAIRLDTALEKVLETIIESGHSRYPVYREDVDDLCGLLYAKDLFQLIVAGGPSNRAGDSAPPSVRATALADIVRPNVRLVPESKQLAELLAEMRQDRQHLVVVVDEFGGTSGIVTLEDVLEEIVGDIRDEYDSLDKPIVELGRGRVMADAAMPLAHLSTYLGADLDPDERYDSLGGMLTSKLGRVPLPGTSVG